MRLRDLLLSAILVGSISNGLANETAVGAQQSSMTQETLFKAVRSGDLAAVETYLAQGGNPDARERLGETALTVGAGIGQKDIVELLVSKGANLRMYGVPALLAALEKNHEDIADFLIARGVSIQWDGKATSPLSFASTMGYKRAVAYLTQRGANVNSVEKNGTTPLHAAIANNEPEIVQMLLDKGARVDLLNDGGSTPLYWASRTGNVRIVRLLVERGAKVNARNPRGWTPLIAALETKHKEAAVVLLEHGADVTAKNVLGLTPLYWAKRNGYEDIAEQLRAKGAKE